VKEAKADPITRAELKLQMLVVVLELVMVEFAQAARVPIAVVRCGP
jgi:hypothetical protein